jgi:hypothetical protein
MFTGKRRAVQILYVRTGNGAPMWTECEEIDTPNCRAPSYACFKLLADIHGGPADVRY